MADLKPGYYLLNTDGGNAGDPLGCAAIGALLRTRRLVAVDQISKTIGPATHNVAEYQALIAGLKLARDHGIERIRVYMDSELVVDQVNGVSAVRQTHLGELHDVASGLVALFKSIRISWVPREMNVEADRLVNDALEALTKSGATKDETLDDPTENLRPRQRPDEDGAHPSEVPAVVATGEGCEAQTPLWTV